MAIIYSYPIAQPLLSDLLLGTHIDPERLHDGNPTKSFTINDIITLASDTILPLVLTPTLQQVTETGNTTNKQVFISLEQIISESNPGRVALEVTNSDFDSSNEQNVGTGIRGTGSTGVVGVGIDTYSTGVVGLGNFNGIGVSGYSANGIGTIGNSPYGVGIFGTSNDGTGIHGYSNNENAIYGYSTNGVGGYFSSLYNYALVANGDVAKPGGGSWSVYSDSRLKENIKPYTKGLAEILLVNTVNYEYNGLANTVKGKEYTGVIAQEIKEIFPETVNIYKNKLNETDEEKTELYDFNSSALTFALINAVKELNAKIKTLELQIEELKTK